MFFISLDKLETVNLLCRICEKYNEYFDVDVEYGRYIVDGASILALTSMLGHIVKIVPNTNDEKILNQYWEEVEKIGGYKI